MNGPRPVHARDQGGARLCEPQPLGNPARLGELQPFSFDGLLRLAEPRSSPLRESLRAQQPVARDSTHSIHLTHLTRLKHSPWDALLISLALVHGAILLSGPPAWLIALGLWWNANTIAHNFIHRPFFSWRRANAGFSLFLSLVLGLPQTLWRDRHLAHHRGIPWRLRWSAALVIEGAAVVCLWSVLALGATEFLVMAYLPGFLLGLGFCELQGHFEHAGGTTSHYRRLYNLLFLNDGYHAEHHAFPGEHWRRLPQRRLPHAQASRWPAVLRWLEAVNLETLERMVLRSKWLQQFVLRRHRQAFQKLLPLLGHPERVTIVGGGLFPRTALILQRLLPSAHLKVIETNLQNIRCAQDFGLEQVQFVHAFYEPTWDSALMEDADLLVVPLAFRGERAVIYRDPPAPKVLVHDWIWRRHGRSVVVAWWLLKRLNLVRRC
jgi:hypothetical protein